MLPPPRTAREHTICRRPSPSTLSSNRSEVHNICWFDGPALPLLHCPSSDAPSLCVLLAIGQTERENLHRMMDQGELEQPAGTKRTHEELPARHGGRHGGGMVQGQQHRPAQGWGHRPHRTSRSSSTSTCDEPFNIVPTAPVLRGLTILL